MTRMPIHLRRRFFYTLIVVFLVLGAVAVLYAQGWRPGDGPFGMTKVGGVYVRTFPTEASVAINGVTEKRNFGLFDRGTLISDLVPDDYSIDVSAQGFHPWRRQIMVRSSFVTRLEYIVLVPENSSLATTTPVKALSAAGGTLVLTAANGSLGTLSGARLGGDHILAGSEDGSMIITQSAKTRAYFVSKSTQATSTPLKSLGAQPQITLQAVPEDNGLFLVRSQSFLGLLRAATDELVRVATTSAIATAADGRVVWAEYESKSRTSLLSYYDISSRTIGRNADAVPGRITALAARDASEIFALTDDGSLYQINLGQSSRTRLAQDVEALFPSPDGEELAVLNGQGVRIFFLRSEQPQVALALPDARRVRRLIWYRDGEHLFVEYPDRVAFLELDDPALSNFITVAETAHAAYVRAENTLYFTKDDTLFAIPFPS